MRGTPLVFHQAEALALQDAAGDNAGDLFGGHHLRLVTRGFALLRAVGREGREADVGCRETRAGYHHMQPFSEVFDAQRFEEPRHGELRGRIARASRQPVQPGDRRDTDNRTVRLLEIRQGEFATVDRTPEIDVHQAVEHLQVDVVENGAHRKPGVANQHVDPPELTYGRVDQFAALADIGHVDAAIGGLPAPGADVARDKL